MTEVKLSPKLPDPRSSDKGGLGVIADALLNRPSDCHLVVMLASASEVTTRHQDGHRTVKAGIEHIEVVLPEDAGEVEAALLNAYRVRTGQAPLPLPGFGGGDQ